MAIGTFTTHLLIHSNPKIQIMTHFLVYRESTCTQGRHEEPVMFSRRILIVHFVVMLSPMTVRSDSCCLNSAFNLLFIDAYGLSSYVNVSMPALKSRAAP